MAEHAQTVFSAQFKSAIFASFGSLYTKIVSSAHHLRILVQQLTIYTRQLTAQLLLMHVPPSECHTQHLAPPCGLAYCSKLPCSSFLCLCMLQLHLASGKAECHHPGPAPLGQIPQAWAQAPSTPPQPPQRQGVQGPWQGPQRLGEPSRGVSHSRGGQGPS